MFVAHSRCVHQFTARLRRPVGLVMVALLGIIMSPGKSSADADDHLAAVIENLLGNEALYEAIEVVWSSSYTLGEMKYLMDGVLRSRVRNGRYVRQDGTMFYIDFQQTQSSKSSAGSEYSLLTAFDGELTRILEDRGGKVGNIAQGERGFRESYRKLLPHTLPLRSQKIRVPLSAWLQGREAIHAHRSKPDKIAELYDTTLRYVGLETVGGLECAVIARESYRRGGDPEKVIGRRVLWLAVDRNYLPVQTKHFTIKLSEDFPMSEKFLDDLREITPGVWFPFSSSNIVYDRGSMRDDGKHVVAWSEDLIVEKAELDPQYDISFFQDIEFPDGTPVYEIEQDEIVRKYVQGGGPPVAVGGDPQDTSSRTSSTMLLLIANAIAFAAIIGYLGVRKLRSS